MDLLALRYFQAVARFEHVSRAAAELRVAQPSVSRTIARLESELDVSLFDRRSGGIRLNDQGRLFLHHVDRALSELDDAQTALLAVSGDGLGTVTLAAETLLTLTGTVAEFRRRYPRAQVRLTQAPAAEMARLLRTGEVDFCIASQPVEGASLESVELMTEDVLLAMPDEHRLAGRDAVRVTELIVEPFVTTRPGHWQRALLEKLFSDEGLVPLISCEGDEPGASQDLISAGLGIGLIPAMSRSAGTRAPVSWARVDAPACQRTLSLVWRHDAYHSTAAQHFKSLAMEQPFPPPPSSPCRD